MSFWNEAQEVLSKGVPTIASTVAQAVTSRPPRRDRKTKMASKARPRIKLGRGDRAALSSAPEGANFSPKGSDTSYTVVSSKKPEPLGVTPKDRSNLGFYWGKKGAVEGWLKHNVGKHPGTKGPKGGAGYYRKKFPDTSSPNKATLLVDHESRRSLWGDYDNAPGIGRPKWASKFTNLRSTIQKDLRNNFRTRYSKELAKYNDPDTGGKLSSKSELLGKYYEGLPDKWKSRVMDSYNKYGSQFLGPLTSPQQLKRLGPLFLSPDLAVYLHSKGKMSWVSSKGAGIPVEPPASAFKTAAKPANRAAGWNPKRLFTPRTIVPSVEGLHGGGFEIRNPNDYRNVRKEVDKPTQPQSPAKEKISTSLSERLEEARAVRRQWRLERLEAMRSRRRASRRAARKQQQQEGP